MASSIFCQEKFSKRDIKDRVEIIQKLISQNDYEKAFELFFSMDKIVDKDDVPRSVEEEYTGLDKILNKKRSSFENNRIKVQGYVKKYDSGEYCSALWLLNLEINEQTAYAKTIVLYENYHYKIQKNKDRCDENKTKIGEVKQLLDAKKYFDAKEEINSINPDYLYVQDEEHFERLSKRIGDKEYDYEEVKGYIIDDPKFILAEVAYDKMIYSDAQDLIDQLEYIDFKAPILISNLDGDFKEKIETDYNAFLPILKEGILEMKSFLKDNPPPYGEEVAKYIKDGSFQIFDSKHKPFYEPSFEGFNIDENIRFESEVLSNDRLSLNDLYNFCWSYSTWVRSGSWKIVDEYDYESRLEDVISFISFYGTELDIYKYKQTDQFKAYESFLNYIKISQDTGFYSSIGELSFYDVKSKCFYADFGSKVFFDKNIRLENLFQNKSKDKIANRFEFSTGFERAESIEDTWVSLPNSGYFDVAPFALYKYKRGTNQLEYLRVSLFSFKTKEELITIIFDDPHRQIKSVNDHNGKIIDFTNFTETTADDYVKTTSSKTPVSFNISEPDIYIEEKIEEESIFDKESSTHDLTEVQSPPMFSGGEEALYRFISENFKWPSEDIKQGNEGRVFVQFVVNEKGGIQDVKVARGINYRLNAESIRVIESMPRWTPGYNDGEAVKVRYMIPIVLKLK